MYVNWELHASRGGEETAGFGEEGKQLPIFRTPGPFGAVHDASERCPDPRCGGQPLRKHVAQVETECSLCPETRPKLSTLYSEKPAKTLSAWFKFACSRRPAGCSQRLGSLRVRSPAGNPFSGMDLFIRSGSEEGIIWWYAVISMRWYDCAMRTAARVPFQRMASSVRRPAQRRAAPRREVRSMRHL
eukprot:gene14726-biopygen9623